MEPFHAVKIPAELKDPAPAGPSDLAAEAPEGVPTSFADWLSQPTPTIAGPISDPLSEAEILICLLAEQPRPRPSPNQGPQSGPD